MVKNETIITLTARRLIMKVLLDQDAVLQNVLNILNILLDFCTKTSFQFQNHPETFKVQRISKVFKTSLNESQKFSILNFALSMISELS